MSVFFADKYKLKNSVKLPPLLRIRDPVPFCGIGFSRIPDIGSQPHIFHNLTTIFWVESTLIFSVMTKQIFFTCSKIKLFTIL